MLEKFKRELHDYYSMRLTELNDLHKDFHEAVSMGLRNNSRLSVFLQDEDVRHSNAKLKYLQQKYTGNDLLLCFLCKLKIAACSC